MKVTSACIRKASYDALLKDNVFLEKTSSNTSSLDNVKSRKEIAVRVLFGNE